MYEAVVEGFEEKVLKVVLIWGESSSVGDDPATRDRPLVAYAKGHHMTGKECHMAGRSVT